MLFFFWLFLALTKESNPPEPAQAPKEAGQINLPQRQAQWFKDTSFPEPTQTPNPTESPLPTAKSGAPSAAAIWGSALGAVGTIALCVSILCFKKDPESGFANTAQILLEKNNI